MPKINSPFNIKCSCGEHHHIDVKHLDKALVEAAANLSLYFNNEIDWYKQRIDELEDELFIWRECVPDKGE